MKKICLLLLVLALLLSACAHEEDTAPMVQPVSFYYRTAQTDFAAADGVIRAEQRDLGAGAYSDLELFRLYFEGPRDRDLVFPASQDTELTGVSRSGGTLELRLTRSAHSPAEFDHAVTYACLAMTGLGLEGVRKVRIRVSTRGGVVVDDLLLTENDLLFFDSGAAPQSTEITLYYTDENGVFLLPEKRTVPLMAPEALPQYVLELLLSPPMSGGMRSALPPGTAVLDLSVENGVCTVDFNGDFYANRPEGEQAELLTVLSVVNTLCELENVSQVQIYAEGRKLSPYVRLDLSQPWFLDGAVIGPVREELGEFAGTLCLPGQQDGLLHRISVRARARGAASREEALMQALFARSAQNGLSAPLAGAPAPLSVSTAEGVCTVDLAAGTLPEESWPRELALRSIAATLCSLPELRSVRILENGTPVGRAPLIPAESWFCQPPTER
ncbi:MAG: GerMN domain-containing protein [Oscillospiraceae bacterium]|nr:GerMN domain-containing protein [Oscillospiraceae bacterium]